MPPKTDIWSEEKENTLIELVKNCPLLWDVSLPAYRRSDIKEQEWDRISAYLGPNFKVDLVKKRWNNIRGTYQNNHRKVENSKRSGASADSVYQPRWKLYNKLCFLDSALQCSESESNLSPLGHSQTENFGTQAYASQVPTLVGTQVSAFRVPTLVRTQEPQAYFDENLHAYMEIPSDNDSQSTTETIDGSSIEIIHQAPSCSNTARPASEISRSSTPVPLGSPPARPMSAPLGTTLFTKRGATKSKNLAKEKDTLNEVLTVMKKVADEPIVMPAKSRAEAFGAYVVTVLKTLTPEQQQKKKLTNYDILFSDD